jgi:hypothetical protein
MPMREYYGYVKDGRVILSADQIKDKQEYLISCKNGTQIYQKFGKIPHPKTDAQLKAFWGLFISTCMNYFEQYSIDTTELLRLLTKFLLENRSSGNEITREFFKRIIYDLCPIFDEDGKQIGLSSMTKEQSAKFYDNACNMVSAVWGIVINECDKDWRKKQDPYEGLKQ